MAKNNFPGIKKALAEHDRKALISLIGELYSLNDKNRDFLEARFSSGDAAFKRYKEIIHDALYPDVMSNDTISFRDAKKAISDYCKAHGEPLNITELFVYAAECGNEFTCDYGDIDEAFYDSLTPIFRRAVKEVSKLSPKEAAPFITRLGNVVKKADGIGWGYYDDIFAAFYCNFPDAAKG